ncbi:CBS domain-containing protein [Psychromarinibacter sp. C21-152]|uniref:CBS domain-containing protein n=1 Tax=Psychromarinibacter sediminicola TaxID=3033385 RepID=A0AAE3NXG3_9RHOB|nr:CBS domain-containing protein [Psychromarinibacter sediminicola]MDF0603912.1 CBS domain-containing protein [Psychromarinibacter sediminicola]
MHIREILHRKGHEVKTVRPDTILEHCAAHMRLERVGALVVCDAEERLKGVIAEGHILQALVDHGPRALHETAADVMDDRPVTCAPGDTIGVVAQRMTRARVRHVPVCEDGKLVGLVSIGDIVRDRFEEMELERGTLRDLAGAHLAAV